MKLEWLLHQVSKKLQSLPDFHQAISYLYFLCANSIKMQERGRKLGQTIGTKRATLAKF